MVNSGRYQGDNPENVTISIVFDNNRISDLFESAWGFSCFIEGAAKNILFDTGGDGELLLRNLKKLDKSPSDIGLIVLSHKHSDHVGGLGKILEENGYLDVCMLPSFPDSIKEVVRSLGGRLIETGDSGEIIEGVYTTGKMGSYIEEQSLIIDTDKGLILITGCAHPGIEKIAERAKQILPKEILLIAGGFHLRDKSENEIRAVSESLKNTGVMYAAPSHCSGAKAFEIFREAYGDHYINSGAGKVIPCAGLK
ncbi:MAG TPA: MBL fold metallo-hydrolase [candidate division Zixibacteria bacterium]|nr:MBL fold metallo-hydrolase [candidate division Zixibacteria bacterium]HEQ98100.1 MBL fold metallo-hydrolase [candidate division Zixibacteria bacterium]